MPARLVITGSDLLASALNKRDLTYEEAAQKLGTSDTFVSMLVNRQRAPGRKVALALRDEFGITLDAPWPVERPASPVHPPVRLTDRPRDLVRGNRRRRSKRPTKDYS